MRFALLAVCFMCSAGCSNTNTHVREDGGVNPLVSDVISGNVEAVSRRIETGEGKLSDRSFGARMTLGTV